MAKHYFTTTLNFVRDSNMLAFSLVYIPSMLIDSIIHPKTGGFYGLYKQIRAKTPGFECGFGKFGDIDFPIPEYVNSYPNSPITNFLARNFLMRTATAIVKFAATVVGFVVAIPCSIIAIAIMAIVNRIRPKSNTSQYEQQPEQDMQYFTRLAQRNCRNNNGINILGSQNIGPNQDSNNVNIQLPGVSHAITTNPNGTQTNSINFNPLTLYRKYKKTHANAAANSNRKIIEASASINETGPITITGDIPEGANIVVKAGSLIIKGNVANNVTIECSAAASINANQSFFASKPGSVIINGNVTGNNINTGFSLFGSSVQQKTGPQIPCFVQIDGNVAADVKVKVAGDFTANGNIMERFKLESQAGNLRMNDIGANSSIESNAGNVTISNVGSNTQIKTGAGDITINNAGPDAQIETGAGNIAANIVAENGKIHTGFGNIKVQTAQNKTVITTGAGNIEVHTAQENTVITTGSGNIKYQFAAETASLTTRAGALKKMRM